jgi:DNA-binding response OmpR family regulator
MQTRILVLNLEAGAELMRSLTRILEEAASLGFELIEHSWPRASSTDCSRVHSEIGEPPPDLILLCFAQHDFDKADAMLKAIRKSFLETPVVFVVESGEPHQLCDLLDLGGKDFFVSPLQSHNVLARIMRLRSRAETAEPKISLVKERIGLKQFVGESESLLKLIRMIPESGAL